MANVKGRKTDWTPEKTGAVGEMLEDGASHREIARTLGVSKNTILKYFPGSAWTNEQSRDHAAMIKKLNNLK